MPLALSLFGKSRPGRFFTGPTLALDVGGSTAWLAGHANPDELAGFLNFCGCEAVVLDEAGVSAAHRLEAGQDPLSLRPPAGAAAASARSRRRPLAEPRKEH